MQEQEQIEKENEEQDEELDMKEFVQDIRDMKQRMNYATYKVQEQDKRLVGVNDKLDDYNKEVKKGDEYMDVINKGIFGYCKDKITGIFKKKKDKQQKLNEKDKDIIEKARNKKRENNYEYHINDEKGWYVIYKGEKDINNIKNEDDILDEALNEVRGMRKAVNNFSGAVKDSTEVVDVTNKNMDNSLKNVNEVNKKMKNHK